MDLKGRQNMTSGFVLVVMIISCLGLGFLFKALDFTI